MDFDNNAGSGASFAEKSGGTRPSGERPREFGAMTKGNDNSPQSIAHGVQPLNGIMEELGLNNHDLVVVSLHGLTHKQIGKGRKGRRVTKNIQDKIARALSAATDQEFSVNDLFTYR